MKDHSKDEQCDTLLCKNFQILHIIFPRGPRVALGVGHSRRAVLNEMRAFGRKGDLGVKSYYGKT